MDFCFPVLAAVIILGMTVMLFAWQHKLNQDFRDELNVWAVSRELTVLKARYVLPIMTLEPFAWRHPNDAVFKVRFHSAKEGAFVGWLAFGRDSFGAPNGTITANF